MHKLLLLVFLTLLFTACNRSPETPGTGPLPFTIQEIIDEAAASGDLDARAIVASGMYEELANENYPLTLILVQREEALGTYLAEQGLTEEAFLAHPKLRDFMEHHLIPSFVDTIEIRGTENGRFVYTSAAGSEVVFTTGENLDDIAEGKAAFANDVPFSPTCAEAKKDVEDADSLNAIGQICFADAPIVQDFDWSE